jgi:ParB family chromosome partitioning protein
MAPAPTAMPVVIAESPRRDEPSVASANGIPLLVPIERVLPNPHQPREYFAHGDLEDLIASIKTHGILQPLIVTEKKDGTYELIAGERRLRASRMAGLSSVPVVIRQADAQEKLELALIENIQRQDLHALEEAKAYRELMDDYHLTQEQVAARVGKSRSQVANTLRLLELPEEIQHAVAAGTVPPSAARTLLSFDSAEEQIRWWQRMMNEKLTVRDVEEAVRRVRGPQRVAIPDANIEADETVLRSALNTKVQVKKHGEAGTISLSFFSTEEYRALVDRLKRTE